MMSTARVERQAQSDTADDLKAFAHSLVSSLSQTSQICAPDGSNAAGCGPLENFGPTIPWVADAGGQIVYAGDGSLQLVGLRPDQAGLGWSRAACEQDQSKLAAAWERSVATNLDLDIEVRFQLPDGSLRWVHVRGSARRAESGQVEGLYGTLEDIHERKSASEALAAAEARYRYAIDLCKLIPWSAGPDGIIQEVGQRWYDVTGVLDDRLGEYGIAAVHPDDIQRTVMAWERCVETGIALDNEYRLLTQGGGYRWYRSRAAPLRDNSGEIIRWYGIIEDVHDRRMSEEDIRWRAAHDALTGAANRTTFYADLDRALCDSRARSATVGVLLFDMDNFKWINDWLGHDAGDKILKHFSTLLGGCDGVARFGRLGGDEFAAIICSDSEEAVEATAARVFTQVQGSLQIGGNWVDLLSSGGLAIFPLHGTDADSLIKNGDLALQNAKATGRKRLRTFHATMRHEREKQGLMIATAKTAINERLIQPYYQPKVSLSEGGVIGFEALLRWHHPTQGPQDPATIEAAFHDRDVGWEISQLMLELVTQDIESWLHRGISFGHVALNVAPSDLLRPEYAVTILEKLHQRGLPSSALQLEVTETVFLGRRAEGVARTLEALDQAGVRIALDDFGTGYASLSHLQRFPVHELKIDRSFIDQVTTLEEAPIACALIGLAKSLRMTSVAEGVETIEQARLLKAAGCDVAQGFLFAQAVPPARVAHLLQRRWLLDELEPLAQKWA